MYGMLYFRAGFVNTARNKGIYKFMHWCPRMLERKWYTLLSRSLMLMGCSSIPSITISWKKVSWHLLWTCDRTHCCVSRANRVILAAEKQTEGREENGCRSVLDAGCNCAKMADTGVSFARLLWNCSCCRMCKVNKMLSVTCACLHLGSTAL